MTEPQEAPTPYFPGLESDLLRARFTEKVLALQCKVGRVQKDKENAFHHYKYVSAEAVLSAVNPALLEAKLASRPVFRLISEGPTEKGRLAVVECTLFGIDSETGYEGLLAVALGSGSDSADKHTMKAMTAAYKYSWTTALAVPTGDDPEADATVDERIETVVSGVPGITRTYTPARPATPSLPASVVPPTAAPGPILPPSPTPTQAEIGLPGASEAKKAGVVEVRDVSEAGAAGKLLNRVQGKIEDFKVSEGTFKTGPNAGQKWTRYDVTVDKLRYSTFDRTEGDKASMLAAGNGQVVVIWEPDKSGRYRNLVAIDAA